MYATELASPADDAASAIAVGCLLLATAVIVCGFIARERIAHSKRTASRTESGFPRTALIAIAAVLIGHIAGSAAQDRWTLPWDLALEVLIYASALQFFDFAATWRGLTHSTRQRAVAGLVLMAFAGSASLAYANGIL